MTVEGDAMYNVVIVEGGDSGGWQQWAVVTLEGCDSRGL